MPGSTREKFTFAAADDNDGASNTYGTPNYAGAAQVASIEAVISNGHPLSGPTNTAQDCHFYYAADANVVYLDNGTWTWGAGSSQIGPGGHDLTSGGCIIHAASSQSSSILPGQYAKSVTLDVEFLGSSGQKHIWAYTVNKNGAHSNNPQSGRFPHPIWQYWGWWQKP
jgi:hypothetical protein